MVGYQNSSAINGRHATCHNEYLPCSECYVNTVTRVLEQYISLPLLKHHRCVEARRPSDLNQMQLIVSVSAGNTCEVVADDSKDLAIFMIKTSDILHSDVTIARTF